MSEEDIAASVANQIMQSARVKPETELSMEQLEELAARKERFRHYWHRQAEERRREEEAERLAAQRQSEEIERCRIAEVKEASRQRVAEHARRINERYGSKPEPSQTDIEWVDFKQRLSQAEAAQQRKARYDNTMRLCDEMIASVYPTPPRK